MEKIKIKNDHYYKNASILLQQIGWKKRFIDKIFRNIPTNTLKLYDEYYSESQMIEKFFIFEHDNKIANVFKNMKKKFTTKYKKIFQNLENTCYTTDQLISMINKYGFGKFSAIAPKNTTFLFEPHITDKWFNTTIKNRTNSFVKFYNSNEPEVLPLTPIEGFNYFYHATNWKSTKNIIVKGPKFVNGTFCLDFGIQPSFYINPDYFGAVEWNEKKCDVFSNECAILVFSIPENTISKKYKYKHFETVNDEWETLTLSSRLCEKDDNDLDEFDFVYGPMVSNVNKIKKDKKTKAHRPIQMQLASKTNKSDLFLKKCLHSVIWFNKITF